MRIARVDVFRYELPLARPLVLRTCICTSRSGLLLRFEDGDGAFAFGEAAPLPGFSREHLELLFLETHKTLHVLLLSLCVFQ